MGMQGGTPQPTSRGRPKEYITKGSEAVSSTIDSNAMRPVLERCGTFAVATGAMQLSANQRLHSHADTPEDFPLKVDQICHRLALQL
jgi:hypothetical protein